VTLLDRLRFLFDHRWAPPRMSDHLDGELVRRDEARIRRHVDVCPECRELLRSLRALLSALGGLRAEPTEVVAEAVADGVRGRLGEGA
jgi:predicted anti-sigma-YlaC factor YlaD